ncbi:MAG: 30S ribosomal protein S5, partial [Rhodobacteraceae bacterium]|nr:30S ribosomal protein S5 [Paracoccaceae bacterium]
IRATIEGLQGQMSPRMVAQRRGRKVADILPKAAEAQAQAPAEAAEA